jgi:hypothetical protein
MRTWDVFDTLIFRRCGAPQNIFRLMAARLGEPRFGDVRARAGEAMGDWGATYDRVAAVLGWSDAQRREAQQLEIEIEKENLLPVRENVDRLRPGDVLVSDMYLPGSIVAELLRSAGVSIGANPLVVTQCGKANGTIWDVVLQSFGRLPDLHTGDNPQADVAMPAKHGIPTHLYRRSEYSFAERYWLAHGLDDVANLLRSVRLQSPYHRLDEQQQLFEDALFVNVPLLVHYAVYLHGRAAGRAVAFPARDSLYLCAIYRTIFSGYPAIPFLASRRTMLGQSDELRQYVAAHMPPHSLIAELFGPGEHAPKFFGDLGHETVYCCCAEERYSWLPKMSLDVYLEFLNAVPFGSFDSFGEFGVPRFQKAEYPERYTAPLASAVRGACEHIDRFGAPAIDGSRASAHLRYFESASRCLAPHYLFSHTEHVDEASNAAAIRFWEEFRFPRRSDE